MNLIRVAPWGVAAPYMKVEKRLISLSMNSAHLWLLAGRAGGVFPIQREEKDVALST
jgi:hypothetical protein